MNDLGHLRPLERRVSQLARAGVAPDEIGRRFNRSADNIERVLVLASLPGRQAPQQQGLRPIERRLLRWRDQGAPTVEFADRFRRSPGHIQRVLALVDYKRERSARQEL